MKNHPRPLALLLPLFLVTAAHLCGDTSPPPPSGKVILLPELAVQDTIKLRPEEKWLSTRFENFEIYTNTSEFVAREVVQRLHRFHSAIALLFPKNNPAHTSNVKIVLCASAEKFRYLSPAVTESTYRATGSHTLSDEWNTYQVINLDIDSVISDADLQAVKTDDAELSDHRLEGFIHNDDLLRREYLHLMLARNNMNPPPWLAEGVTRYFATTKTGIKRIEFGRLSGSTVAFFRSRPIMSLEKFFAVTTDSPEYISPLGTVFSEQALVFVHFGMFAHKMRYQKAFLALVERASTEPTSEALLKKCFNMTYAQLETELVDYVSGGAYRHPIAPKTKDFPPTPKFKFHQLTPAESGRLQGDILRLLKRPADARLEFISPVIRHQADTPLLAALGQLDYENGNRVTAKKFLEEAVAANAPTAAPYLALARLRFDTAREATPNQPLTAKQTASILTPLYAALSQKITHADLYTLIADAWLASKTAPTFENLAVLDEGVLAYPRNTDLIYKNAVLKAHHGFTDDARSLIDLGLKISREPSNRNRFEQLRNTLPPLPVPATP